MEITVKVYRKDGAPVKANEQTGELLESVCIPPEIYCRILNGLNGGKVEFEPIEEESLCTG